MEHVTFRQGEVIFRQNDTENFMYAILAGTVGIYKDYGTERENKVAELEAGKFLGEMELVARVTWSSIFSFASSSWVR